MEDVHLTTGTVSNGTGLKDGKVDLTDNGIVSNGGTKPKDGLNKVDLTNDGKFLNGGPRQRKY